MKSKIMRLRSDNGKEYCNRVFEDYLRKYGIIHETTVPYNPEQNGVSERCNRTIIEKALAMLEDSGLERRYWGEAVNTAIYLKNRSPTVAIKDATPEELWTGNKINIKYLGVFGSRAFIHIPKETRTKLDPKSKEHIMVGYSETTKGYRLADPERPGKVVIARSVIFIESEKINIIETQTMTETVEPLQIIKQETDPEEILDTSEDNSSERNDESSSTSSYESTEEEIIEVAGRARRPPVWMKDYETNFHVCVLNDDPQTVQEAFDSPQNVEWKRAMQTEYDSMLKNNVWELVDRPKGVNIIKCKWVFKTKTDTSGNVERFRARLVAKGFTQRYGVDYPLIFTSCEALHD